MEVARGLLGCRLVIDPGSGDKVVATLVEVEAYLGLQDPASHAYRGPTPRAAIMFGPPGRLYVYLIYGMHHCMNVVVEAEGKAAAVLLRAIEPVAGIEGRTQGPGLLCRALHIDRRHNGVDLTGDTLFLTAPAQAARIAIVKRPRVGVDYAGHWARRLLRFYVKGNAFVSRA